jgi:hypothetical protein
LLHKVRAHYERPVIEIKTGIDIKAGKN